MQTQAKDKEQKKEEKRKEKRKKEKRRKEKYKEKKRAIEEEQNANPFYAGLFFSVFCALDRPREGKTGYSAAVSTKEQHTYITSIKKKCPFGTNTLTRANAEYLTKQRISNRPTKSLPPPSPLYFF